MLILCRNVLVVSSVVPRGKEGHRPDAGERLHPAVFGKCMYYCAFDTAYRCCHSAHRRCCSRVIHPVVRC
jgi:hypothetical protein